MRSARLSGWFWLERISGIAERLWNRASGRTKTSLAFTEANLHPGDEGDEIADRVKTLSLEIYSRGREHAAQKGIIVADTKFEFGTIDGELLLIDECLTPDSSRFWPKDEYVVGQSPPSFDKQFVRDYLETLDWDKTPPAPRLPKDVIEKTSAKYLEAFRRLTGHELVNA